MPLVHECAKEGCAILTMGELCLLHEAEETQLDAALLAAAAEAAADADSSAAASTSPD
ncbi:MAG: hypothetical protein ACXVRJ_10775 [Gaiellaceae bacterium]